MGAKEEWQRENDYRKQYEHIGLVPKQYMEKPMFYVIECFEQLKEKAEMEEEENENEDEDEEQKIKWIISH